ncbi:MAG: DUF3987 domain-containing protein [Planctomycetes bacterium]|nr:DUF3987 domain-containing protein [Planctomycetota bacterium]
MMAPNEKWPLGGETPDAAGNLNQQNPSVAPPGPQADAALFISAIFEPDDILEVRLLGAGRPFQNWLAASQFTAAIVEDIASRAADRNLNVYVGANPRKTRSGGKAGDVALARCFFVDWDGIDEAEARGRIEAAGLPPPTVLVFSGHGVHAYWRLEEPIKDLALWSEYQKSLIGIVGSDPAIHDPPRIMRLPGFLNVKSAPVLTRIIEVDAKQRYPLSSVTALITKQPKVRPDNPPASRDEATLIHKAVAAMLGIGLGQTENDGSKRLFSYCCRGVELGLHDLGILTAVRGAESVAPFPKRWSELEIKTRIADARKRTAPKLTAALPEPQVWRAFPTHILPRPVAAFVRENAASKQCDESLIALPSLSVLASAIGTTREVALRDDWREPPTQWSCVIIRSGGVKSPALEAALKPLCDAEHQAQMENQQARAEYELARLRYEKDHARWKSEKANNGDPPERPDPPRRRRHVVSDITTEALAPILQENPRGVLVARDELAGLIRSFNCYKKDKGGDTETWLQLHRAGFVSIDRKTNRENIYIPRTTASVCGTIQPSVFAAVMRGEHLQNGLTARFLLAWPPAKRKRFTNSSPSPDSVGAYEAVIQGLLQLQHVQADGMYVPETLPLADDAREAWAKWYDSHADRQFDAGTDEEAACLAKLEAVAARFALIFVLVKDPRSRVVDADSIERGCILANWFADEAARVYAIIEAEDRDELAPVVRWIQGRGGSCTPRDLTRGPREFRGNTRKATFVLTTLAENGRGTIRYEKRDTGPSVLVFTLHSGDITGSGNSGDGDTFAASERKNGEPVAVAIVTEKNATPENEGCPVDERPPVTEADAEATQTAWSGDFRDVEGYERAKRSAGIRSGGGA